MSADIGKGDFVEVIAAPGGTLPVGTVVRVEGVRHSSQFRCLNPDGSIFHDRGTCFGVRIEGGPNPADGRFWAGCCFRPIYRPRTSFIEGLLQPAPHEQVPA
jgi:hypothetical protein